MGKRNCSMPACDNAGRLTRGLCRKHYTRLVRYGDPSRGRPSLEQRFWSKVKAAEALDCWEWIAGLFPDGYGSVRDETGKTKRAHRLAWEMLRGEIPDELHLDHLCRNRICVNPWHLDPVSPGENIRRGATGEVARARQLTKTHCPQGHPYSGENLGIASNGSRQCRTCIRERGRRRYRQQLKTV